MSHSVRFWQKVMIGASLIGVVMSSLSGNWYSAILPLVCVMVSLFSPTPEQRVQEQISLLQQQGVYLQGQATDEDVQRVLQAGHKLLAIRLYREVHGVPLKQAVAAVKQMM